MGDCDVWFQKNKSYLDSLDWNTYGNYIIDYYLNYCYYLQIRAFSYSEQKDYYKAIELHNLDLFWLKRIPVKNDSVKIRIALNTSYISYNYSMLKELSKAKEFINEAYNVLQTCSYPDSTHDEFYNNTYCSILNTISFGFYRINNFELAKNIRLESLNIKKEFGIPATIMDTTVLMSYCRKDTFPIFSLGEELERNHQFDDPSMFDVYGYIGAAYSQLMHQAIQNGSHSNVLYYDSCAISYFKKAEECIVKQKKYFDEHDFTKLSYADLYNYYSTHYARKCDLRTALSYSLKAAKLRDKVNFDLLNFASFLNEQIYTRQYLPLFYNYIIQEIKSMLPVLGSVETDTYLLNGKHALYSIPEIISRNPNDSICTAIGYNSALLTKGLSLEYCSLASASKKDANFSEELSILYRHKDSIFTLEDDKERLLSLLEYEKREAELRSKVLTEHEAKLFNDWKDIQAVLHEDDIAIEIVGYQANNWIGASDSSYVQYDAIIVDKQCRYPIYVSLFHQYELIDVYDNQPTSYNQDSGIHLFNSLWGKLDPYIKNKKRVFFSPIGLVNLVNIECLMDEKGETAFEKYPLYRLSSTRQLLNEYNDIPNMNTISVFGGINYQSEGHYENLDLDSLNTRSNWAYLSNSHDEAIEIKATLQERDNHVAIFTGDKATELAFKQIAKTSPDIIHLSTHGFFIPNEKRMDLPYYKESEDARYIQDDLFYSGLAFAHGDSIWNKSTFALEANDGVLSAYEISKLNLSHTDLVVLSACETAIGERTFDGISGLQRAFKLAGANTIIMSLWKVDDLATSFFMKEFYNALTRTKSKREAFVQAIQATRLKFENPYYWASFIMLD